MVIGIDAFQDTDIPSAVRAESDAAAFAQCLGPLDFELKNQIVLLGSQATRTSIESRLRKLARELPAATDCWVYYAGQGFTRGNKGFLLCTDSQLDDLIETTVSVESILDVLQVCPGQVALFVDDRGGWDAANFPNGYSAGLPAREWVDFTSRQPSWVVFTASRPNEASFESGLAAGGIWSHHLREGLVGHAPAALENGVLLTAASLHKHLEREVPRTLRKVFKDGRKQVPCLYAAKGQHIVLGNLAAILSKTGPKADDPRLQPLKVAILRGEKKDKVKNLNGFTKQHRLPEKVNAYANKYVAELAAADVRADVDAVFAALRTNFGYKRRDLETSADLGSGFVRTADFEYSVRIRLSEENPGGIVWRREVSHFQSADVFQNSAFAQTFEQILDAIVFEFARPFDVAAWVDRLEDDPPEGVSVQCNSDGSEAKVSFAVFPEVICLNSKRVEFQLGQGNLCQRLVEVFLRMQDLFAATHGPPALSPLASSNRPDIYPMRG
jgi:hypothetical protein